MSESSSIARVVTLRRGPVGSITARAGRRGLVAVVLAAAAVAALTLSGGQAPEPSASSRQAREDEGGEGNETGSVLPRRALAYPLARLVPSDALAFASVRDVRESLRRADTTGIGRMFDDPEVEPFLGSVTTRLFDRLAGAVVVMQSLKLAVEGGGEAAFAVLGIDREAGRPEAVFLADVAGRESQARSLLDFVELSALRRARPKCQFPISVRAFLRRASPPRTAR